MKQAEQARLVRDLITSVGAELQEMIRSGHVPEDWDGIELRQWVAEKFAGHGTAKVKCDNHYPVLSGRRLRDYHNTVVCRNL